MKEFFIKPRIGYKDSKTILTNMTLTDCDKMPDDALVYFRMIGVPNTYTTSKFEEEQIDIESLVNAHPSIAWNETFPYEYQYQEAYTTSTGRTLFPYIDPSNIASHEGKLTFTGTNKSYRIISPSNAPALNDITVIPAGMSPHFRSTLLDHSITASTGTITISRSSTSLTLGSDTKSVTYSNADFPNEVIPINLLVVLQARGGDGGAGNAVASGAGGGGGACAICLINTACSSYSPASYRITNSSGTLTLQAMVSGGAWQSYVQVSKGGNAGITQSTGSGGTVKTFDTTIEAGITLLKSVNGASGGMGSEFLSSNAKSGGSVAA